MAGNAKPKEKQRKTRKTLIASELALVMKTGAKGREQDSTNLSFPPGSMLHYIVGGAGAGPERRPDHRDFPLVHRGQGEDAASHLERVLHLLHEAMVEGGTHLTVPREHADWLGDHPYLGDYLSERHDLVEADPEAGITFGLRHFGTIPLTVEVEGWQIVPGEGILLQAERDLIKPQVTIRLLTSARGRLTGQIVFRASGVRTLRFRFARTRAGRSSGIKQELMLSLDRPGFLIHELPFVEATFDADGTVRLEFDLELKPGRLLDRIILDVIEEDNWRLHPNYPGGGSFALPSTAPAGAQFQFLDLSVRQATIVRNGPPYGTVQGTRPAPYRKPRGRKRDAVIFSSWAPDEGLVLGDYFIDTLKHWHADSKIFVGVNHGSSAEWTRRLEQSGLDVTIRPARASLTMPFDPTGFITALDAYRRQDELFDLVWFGHNKGGDHLDEVWYGTGRWTIERMFWARRAEIKQYFQNPIIGLYTPHYLMMLPEHLSQTDTLARMYSAPCAPLGAMAVSAHFVQRDESVRDFCLKVDERLFREGPERFGGDRFFAEMALPNVPIMQGYEPFIEEGLGGTTGLPKMNGVESILNDWRHNNAVTAIELNQWRKDPTRFRTRHREHNRVD